MVKKDKEPGLYMEFICCEIYNIFVVELNRPSRMNAHIHV